MSRLHEVDAMGQSIWLDDLRRGLLTTGELQRLIEQDAVTGVTSNPTIFAKAISGSTDYDDQLRDLVNAGAEPEELYVSLVTEDIQRACDVFGDVWRGSRGERGFVSIEVSPRIAHDTEVTVAEAREWSKRIDRDNLFVKVPATPAGISAIERLTAEGIAVNVTLIFSLDRYRAVAEAYISGLERFVAHAGNPVNVPSVASFFVSRIDVEIDERLDELAERDSGPETERLHSLKGKAGIANARAAYGIFLELFSSERWRKLADRGARVQRPLWASTGVKDPDYRDTMYVEELIANDSVNTMPEATLRAFQDHGEVRAPFTRADMDDAVRLLDELASAGIDYDDVTDNVLERKGVEKFAQSFDQVLDCLEAKREAVLKDRKAWALDGVDPRPPGGLATKIWTKDASAWGPGEDDPADRLGWLTLPDVMEGRIGRLERFARGVIDDGIEVVVLLGMGGSSLAPEVYARTFGPAPRHPSLIVLDSTHPAQIAGVEDRVDPDRTLFLVSSKSGGTVETMSLYRHFRSLVDDGRRFVAITDPGTSLERLADEERFRATFVNPPDVGGRYSALTYFGLVPAALLGVDLRALIDRAHEMAHASERCVPAAHNPGLMIGAAMAELAAAGRDKLTFVISDEIASFGDWVEQLIAESTGKQQTGIVPIVHEPVVDPSRYGNDRVFVHVRLDGDSSDDDFIEGVKDAGHPVVTVSVATPIGLGAEIFRWEFATAAAGSVLGINAFDQPDVEAAKRASREILDSASEIDWEEEDPDVLFDEVEPGALVALLAFVPAGDGAAELLASARRSLTERFGVATMAGFGPRYLHSTGQLHKGGPPRVSALVILDEPERDEPIPGSEHGFARLLVAQAAGDVRALRAAGRRVATTTWARFASWVEGTL